MATPTHSGTRRPVLTAEGREALEVRLARARERLATVTAECEQERTEALAEERQRVGAQIEELAQLLQQAVAPGDVRDDPTIVELGDEVEVELPDGSRQTLLIVHPLEASLDERRTSSESPLAKAVLGHRPGDRVTVQAPGGVYGCRILNRERSD